MRGAVMARGWAPAVLLLAVAPCALANVPHPGPPHRILTIHAFESGLPVNAIFVAALRTSLPLGTEVTLYSEHLDRLRFPDRAYEEAFRGWLHTKYAAAPPDLIVAVGAEAVDFLADPAKTPFPHVPVVFGLVSEEAIQGKRLPPNFTGLAEHFAIRETVGLALELFPGTRQVVVVGGGSAQDRPLNELLRSEVARASAGLEIVELFGLPMDELQRRLGALPPRSVVFALSFLRDGAGRQLTGPQSVPMMVSASSAPLFTFFENLVGSGTVGGVVSDFASSGRAAAGLVQRVLGGEPAGSIPVQRADAGPIVLDGRQLDRWGVPDGRVPAGAEVRFREVSPWVTYRWAILLTLAGLVLQAALITLLLLERRRRWSAEAKARERLAEVAHMNRVSALGELVGSLAHEINSPLGAVLNNAEAAQRLMAAGPGEEAEVRSCLEDIARDVTRASDVLRRIRGVLKHETWTPARLDLGQVIRDAVRLVRADARDRRVSVDVVAAPELPSVTGDEVQLVQVVLNLLLNALDAVSGMPEDRRRVRISAEPQGAGVAVRVEDSGPGVPPELAARVFEPFFTTKPSGLGMGLGISRSIVEAHGGTITLSAAPDGGAAFELRLPASDEHRAAAGAPRPRDAARAAET